MKITSRRTALVVAIVLSQLAAVYLLVSALEDELTGQFVRDAEVTLESLADGVTDRTQRFLTAAETAVRTGAELIDREVLDAADDRELERFLISQLNAVEWLSGMYVGRPDGSFVYVARNEHGLRTKLIRVDEGRRVVSIRQRDGAGGKVLERWSDPADDYDPRTRGWYVKAKAEDGLVWTDPYRFFSSGRPGITAATDTAEAVVLGADIDVHELSSFIARIPHAEHGRAVIIDGERHAIAATASERLASLSESIDMPTFDQVAGRPLSVLHDLTAGTDGRSSVRRFLRFDVGEDAFVGLVRPFAISGGKVNWTLLVQVSAHDYAGGALGFLAHRLGRLGALSVALGVLTLVGVVWLQREQRRLEARRDVDERSGALTPDAFEAELRREWGARAGACRDEARAIMVLELVGFQRLVDTGGSVAGDVLVRGLHERLREALHEGELIGRASPERLVLALRAESAAALRARIPAIHRVALASERLAEEPAAEPSTIASGAAVLEHGEPVNNLVQRARESLALGAQSGEPGCRVAPPLGGPSVSGLPKAA